MYPEFGVAIVGSGPAGMSAATRAAKSGLSHILLERRPNLTDTDVTVFTKRKQYVMAAPHNLPLRSDLGFKEGAREEVLEDLGARSRRRTGQCPAKNAEIVSITGERGAFELHARRRRARDRGGRHSCDRGAGQPAPARHPRRRPSLRAVSARRSRRVSRRVDHRDRGGRRRDRERAGAGIRQSRDAGQSWPRDYPRAKPGQRRPY